jgi:hypothetical protein
MNRKMLQRCGIQQYTKRSYRKQARYNNSTQKRENMHTDRCCNTRRQKYLAKGSGKEAKMQEVLYTDTTNMKPEKNKIIPVKNGATKIVTKGLRKNLEAITGKHSIDSLNETAILATSHIIRKVPQSKI